MRPGHQSTEEVSQVSSPLLVKIAGCRPEVSCCEFRRCSTETSQESKKHNVAINTRITFQSWVRGLGISLRVHGFWFGLMLEVCVFTWCDSQQDTAQQDPKKGSFAGELSMYTLPGFCFWMFVEIFPSGLCTGSPGTVRDACCTATRNNSRTS